MFRSFIAEHDATLNLILDPLVHLFQVVGVQVDTTVHLGLIINLRCLMTHIWLEVEAGQVRDVIEGHLLDSESEPALIVYFTKGSVRGPLRVLDPQLALVAHRLQILALLQRHGVSILELPHLRKFL